MKERAPGLREEWRRQAIDDPVTAAAVAVDPEGAVLVFAFETARRGPWTVLEQPTEALGLARMILEKAELKGWQPARHPQISKAKLNLKVKPTAVHGWVFDSAVILTFEMSDGQDQSFLLHASLALGFARAILRLHETGKFVDLNAALPPDARPQ